MLKIPPVREDSLLKLNIKITMAPIVVEIGVKLFYDGGRRKNELIHILKV
jgi:hypothetical protein